MLWRAVLLEVATWLVSVGVTGSTTHVWSEDVEEG